MSRAKVTLDESAFIGLVLSSTEVYKRECYGALLGYTNRGIRYVRETIPYQTALRKPTSVELIDARRRTVATVLRAMPRHNYLGEYHSHVGYGDDEPERAISKVDLARVRDGEIEVLIAVKKRSSYRPWRHNADGTLSGVAGAYHLVIRAYVVERVRSKPRAHPVPLKCKYAVTTANSERQLLRRASQPGP